MNVHIEDPNRLINLRKYSQPCNTEDEDLNAMILLIKNGKSRI